MIRNSTATRTRWLEYEDRSCDMRERLRRAADRVAEIENGQVDGSAHTLHEHQVGVYVDFAEFLKDAADDPASFRNGIPTGRIVLPPRTGKTVLAGQIIAGAGMMTTFIVPTRTLVEQAAADLREQLPDIPVGVYYGEEKSLVMWGVNVTTYQILQSDFATKGLPVPIMLSSLVVADEGHRAMTVRRQKVLREGFDPHAVRVALTATPNYSTQRMLAKYFERLIHEITISEAVELGMVAPLRVWIAEVDIDASTVELVAGDYDQAQLGRVTQSAPFLEGARYFRYHPLHREKPALICCSSREQAYHLQDYLRRHRPAGTPAPEVVVSETKGRQDILRRFEAGEIDTLINVGVLIEGWNSPRCKLLIDLALSRSWVRSAQKFFRPMTKHKGEEAHICMLIPKGLPELPVLPLDLFEWNMPDYEQGDLIAPKKKRQEDRQKHKLTPVDETPVSNVNLRSSIVFHARFEKPQLDPRDFEQVKKVLESHDEVGEEQIPLYQAFRHMVFDHPLFRGRGANLLRYCGVEMHKLAYVFFMSRFFPEAASDLYSGDRQYVGAHVPIDKSTCTKDHERLIAALNKGGEYDERFVDTWRAMAGREYFEEWAGDPSAEEEFERHLVRHEKLGIVLREVLATLTKREEQVIRMRFGIGEEECTLEEAAQVLFVTRERVRQMEMKALRKLSHPARCSKLLTFLELLD